MLHPLDPPNRETQISRYLVVQIQIEILISCEFVPRNFGFLDSVDFGDVVFSVESAIRDTYDSVRCHVSGMNHIRLT